MGELRLHALFASKVIKSMVFEKFSNGAVPREMKKKMFLIYPRNKAELMMPIIAYIFITSLSIYSEVERGRT